MKKEWLLSAGVIVIVVLLFSYFHSPRERLHLPDKDIFLIVVDTPQSREQGLSNIGTFPENSAMLFVFDTPDRYAFWMKDMKFPLDIIWLDEKYTIIHIAEDISPQTFPETFRPPQESLFVIEANAGFARENSLKIGDILKMDLKK